MAISLYAGSVPGYLQTLDAVSGFLAKGLVHCRDTGIDPEAIVETRLYPDMLPFRFQVQSTVYYSLGAIEAVRRGSLNHPPGPKPPDDYATLQALISETRATLRALTAAEIDGYEGADVVFQVRDRRRVFTAENFLLSFSIPSFHFHATTAYDILRAAGVPVGKRDYVGMLRLNP